MSVFDIARFMSPQGRLNPFPLYRRMREGPGIFHVPGHDLWNVFKYDDVKTVLSDYRRFSSQFRDAPQGGALMITTDPPRHTRLRTLVNRAFTPGAVDNLEGRIVELANWLLDQVIHEGEMDLAADLTTPLPVMVIAEMLGIPTEDREQFKVWSDAVVESADVILMGPEMADDAGYDEAMGEIRRYFQGIIDRRRQEPRDDLISGLITAEVDGRRLTDHEILDFCWLLLVAGNETTTNLVTNAMHTLLEHPEAMTWLMDDLDRVPLAVEEVLRYRSPVQAMWRRTTADVEICGRAIPGDRRVVAWIGSANRDEEVFSEGEHFRPDRQPNPHLAFGHGPHFCLGAPLARLEARIMLQTLLSRCSDFRRTTSRLEPVPTFFIHGLKRLPVTFRRREA